MSESIEPTKGVDAASVESVVLLPCPFCGCSTKNYCMMRTEPVSDYVATVDLFWVECLSCESRGPVAGSQKSASTRWNNRVESEQEKEYRNFKQSLTEAHLRLMGQ